MNLFIIADEIIELVEGYLARFDDELDQINLKNSIGGKKSNKRRMSTAR